MKSSKVRKIFKTLSIFIPNPATELNYTSNFELLIAAMLSTRTTDKIVNKITEKLFKIGDTPEKILQLKVSGVKKQIKSAGFFNIKAANMIRTCKILINQYHSQVPSTRKLLEELPGVGRKIANVILNIAFDQPTIAVDTHVLRVSNRCGLVNSNSSKETEVELTKIIPKKFLHIAGNLLLLHGKRTCVARKPRCTICTISKFCNYTRKLAKNRQLD
jgi:endonuclease-3